MWTAYESPDPPKLIDDSKSSAKRSASMAILPVSSNIGSSKENSNQVQECQWSLQFRSVCVLCALLLLLCGSVWSPNHNTNQAWNRSVQASDPSKFREPPWAPRMPLAAKNADQRLWTPIVTTVPAWVKGQAWDPKRITETYFVCEQTQLGTSISQAISHY